MRQGAQVAAGVAVQKCGDRRRAQISLEQHRGGRRAERRSQIDRQRSPPRATRSTSHGDHSGWRASRLVDVFEDHWLGRGPRWAELEDGFAAPGRDERLANRDSVGTQGHDGSATTAPALVVRIRNQQHDGQPRPIQVLQEHVAQAQVFAAGPELRVRKVLAREP